MDTSEMIAEMIQRARQAQRKIENYTQEQVLELARALALTAIRNAEPWAKASYAETDLGDVESKIRKITTAPRGLMRDLLEAKTVGVVERCEEKKLIKIAKPVGVIAALAPMTIPETLPVFNSMNAIMGRNAIIFTPHPRAVGITSTVCKALSETLERFGAPGELIQCLPFSSKEGANELMRQADLSIVTGSAGSVKAAYQTGKPAYGVGAGNVVTVIDSTADIADAAHKIRESETNDQGLGCSTENSILIMDDVYDQALEALKKEHGVMLNAEEKEKLGKVLWTEKGGFNTSLVCRPAGTIAQAAGITIPQDAQFIMVEEDGWGPEHIFSREKLSVVVAVYHCRDIKDAIRITNGIQSYEGAGHSCGIHSHNRNNIMEYALGTKTVRVMINSPQNKANAGSFQNGMPYTNTLSCGTWGGGIASENITWKHYINTTWVAEWFDEPIVPDDRDLFGDVLEKF